EGPAISRADHARGRSDGASSTAPGPVFFGEHPWQGLTQASETGSGGAWLPLSQGEVDPKDRTTRPGGLVHALPQFRPRVGQRFQTKSAFTFGNPSRRRRVRVRLRRQKRHGGPASRTPPARPEAETDGRRMVIGAGGPHGGDRQRWPSVSGANGSDGNSRAIIRSVKSSWDRSGARASSVR